MHLAKKISDYYNLPRYREAKKNGNLNLMVRLNFYKKRFSCKKSLLNHLKKIDEEIFIGINYLDEKRTNLQSTLGGLM